MFLPFGMMADTVHLMEAGGLKADPELPKDLPEDAQVVGA